MSDTFEVVAEPRTDGGKGASRRLRRQGLVPGIVYGGHRDPQMVSVQHSELYRQLDYEAFYSSLLDLKLEGETAQVVLKDLQRHPSKPFVIHVDFQRVSAKDKLRMSVPLHFENEDTSVGVKAGGAVSHNLTEVEITCLPKDLPEYIAVDMARVDMGDSILVSDLKLPEGVELTYAMEPDTTVVSIYAPYAGEETEGAEGEEGEGAGGDITPE
ncbi:50S ribosomal protein L25/general stress protein Ctc [Thiohalocapsa halophila]|uniref:Large ribosomal subunit protein bL25 n=1 Tax=Thiohalocapsa halophila TaxID=69359 RepID=A0ABS1CMN8_9GAMM|nr:50S ribosomal protein L25/general stress protein Ctc [Thiohalocapsa halophila]MBK1633196.1 50S ribosomal protein L25/general stress protein Ctc [Thiohalocapsa halophila]